MEKLPTDHIEGINCVVNNCKYNKENLCTADTIQVGPHFAASIGDTNCSTFQPQ